MKKAELVGGPYGGKKAEIRSSFLIVRDEGNKGVYKLMFAKEGIDFYIWVGYNNPNIVNGYEYNQGLT